jgi:periplasmic protein TonB
MSGLLLSTAIGMLMTQSAAADPAPALSGPPIVSPPLNPRPSSPPPPPPPPVYTVPSPPSSQIPAGPGVVRRPVAIDRVSWIDIDDYPAAALRNEEQGLVMTILTIGVDGRVSDCRITFSSQSPALDAATCRLFRSRARYRPARDANGDPIAGQAREQVRWVLPAEPVAFTPSAALVVVRQAHGRVGTCRPARASDGSRLATETCNTFAPVGPAAPEAVARGRPRFAISMEVEVDGAPPADVPELPAGLRLAVEAEAVVELEDSGLISTCRATPARSASGAPVPGFDLCRMLRRPGPPLFRRPGDEGRRRGRITVEIYDS